MKHYSDSFCVYPWVSLMAQPGGRAAFCCIAQPAQILKSDGSVHDLSKDTLQEAWNSQFMRDLRRDMLEGKTISACSTCDFQQSIGKLSYREMHNQEWEDKLGTEELEWRIDESLLHDYEVIEPPAYLDLRLGNLCNLKCRMCNPYNSTMILKEWRELDEETDGAYSAFWSQYGLNARDIGEWYESDIFWTSVEQFIPDLKKVYMTGGEPTLIQGNYRFLHTCIDLGYADQIELFFNLNFTNITDRFINLINQFKWTSINASLDGVGGMNEYIREGSNWDKLAGNFKKLASSAWGNVGLGVSPVVQVYNLLDMVDLLEWAEGIWQETDREILIDFLYNEDTPFLDVKILPETIKREAKERMVAYRDRSRLYGRNSDRSRFVKSSVDSFINLMESTMFAENPEMIGEFLRYTKTLDDKRGQSMGESCGDLTRMLALCGYQVDKGI